MNYETWDLEQYRCSTCGCRFYVDATQPHPFDFDFRCPYGCGHDSVRQRNIVVETRIVAGRRVSDCRGIKCYYLVLSFSGEDFEEAMHRRPQDQKEFDRWAFFMEKGMFEGNIDWGRIRECACEAMQHEGDQNE